jgi:hypothetical protein
LWTLYRGNLRNAFTSNEIIGKNIDRDIAQWNKDRTPFIQPDALDAIKGMNFMAPAEKAWMNSMKETRQLHESLKRVAGLDNRENVLPPFPTFNYQLREGRDKQIANAVMIAGFIGNASGVGSALISLPPTLTALQGKLTSDRVATASAVAAMLGGSNSLAGALTLLPTGLDRIGATFKQMDLSRFGLEGPGMKGFSDKLLDFKVGDTFKQANLKRFELEGPGGMSRGKGPQEVTDKLVAKQLEHLIQVIQSQGGGKAGTGKASPANAIDLDEFED